MLTYKSFIFIVITTVIVLSILHFFVFPIEYWLILTLITLFIAILVVASSKIWAGFYIKTVCSVKNKNKEIAITFDDGPDASLTPAILDVLEKYEIKAAFFCIGSKVYNSPEIVQMIDNKGHVLGNHSYSHSHYFDFWTKTKMQNDIFEAENTIQEIIGKRVNFFRPPYGVTNPALSSALKKTQYKVIGWSLRSLDTTSKDVNLTLKRMKDKLKSGDIILLHDTTPFIIELLEDFIPWAINAGYKFVKLDQLTKLQAYD